MVTRKKGLVPTEIRERLLKKASKYGFIKPVNTKEHEDYYSMDFTVPGLYRRAGELKVLSVNLSK